MQILKYNKLKDENHKTINYFDIENELNYVAIGDSVSAGYNAKFGFQSCGYLNDNGEVIGLSYPAFFSRMIQEIKPQYLKSFYNFSFSNITAKQYLEVLSSENLSPTTKKIFDLIDSLNTDIENPFKGEYLKEFGHFEHKNLHIITEKLQNANLVTINLGANDWVRFMPIKQLKNVHNAQKVEAREKAVEELHEALELRATKVEKYISSIIEYIKKINSTTNIVVVGYSLSLLHFENVINELVDIEFYNNDTATDILMGYLNNALKKAANDQNVMFINTNDLKFWKKHKNFLNETYFDIHPTEKGYKFIAQSLILKLGLNNSYVVDAYKQNNQKILSYLPEIKHYRKDFLSYKKILNLANNDNSVLIKTLGLNRCDKLFLNDSNELKFSQYLVPNNKISWLLSHLESQLDLNVAKLIISFIDSKFTSEEYHYKTKDNLLDFLKERKWARQIVLNLLRGDAFNTFLFDIQKNIVKQLKYSSTLTTKNLAEAKNNSLKNQKLIYDIFKNLLSASFILDSKDQLKEINYVFLTELLTTPLLETLVNHKLDIRYKYLRNYLADLNSFKEFADFLFMNFTINLKNYSELNTFDEMWVKWLNLNHYKIIFYFDKILNEVTLEENMQKSIDFMRLSILLIYKIPANTVQNTEELDKKIENLLWLVKEYKNKLNKYLAVLMEESKSFSIYDYIFSQNRKQEGVAFGVKILKKLKYINVLRKFTFAIVNIRLQMKKIKRLSSLKNLNRLKIEDKRGDK